MFNCEISFSSDGNKNVRGLIAYESQVTMKQLLVDHILLLGIIMENSREGPDNLSLISCVLSR